MNENYSVATHDEIVTLSSTQTITALAANTARRYALFINDSDTTQYLALGSSGAVNTGIRLNSSGGSYEMLAGRGNVYRGAVSVVCATSGKTLLVTEGV